MLTTEEIVPRILCILPQEGGEEESTIEDKAPQISAKELLMCLKKLKSFAVQHCCATERSRELGHSNLTHDDCSPKCASVARDYTAFYKNKLVEISFEHPMFPLARNNKLQHTYFS